MTRSARSGASLGVVAVLATACGGGPPPQAGPHRAPAAAGRVVFHAGPGEAATLGPLTWSLDQLAAAPGIAPNPPVLLAVLRASTIGPADQLHTTQISLLDDAGERWSPVPIPVYVPIDGLDGAPIEPAHSAAGVVAFRLPPGRRGVAVAVRGGGDEVLLDAPR